MASNVEIDGGSFRDPSGFVFHMNDEVYRCVDDKTWDLMKRLNADNVLKELTLKSLIVETELVAEDGALYSSLRDCVPGHVHFLHHAKIPFVSYPYEWTPGMIAAAALLQLELQMRLVKRGYSLKDASIFNVQFIGSKPVFIDIPSIEIPPRFDLWVAYGQFCRMFLFPLLLRKHCGFETRAYYLSHIDGIDVTQVYEMIGLPATLRPSLLIDVFLQRWLHGYGSSRGQEAEKKLMESKKTDPSAQVLNLQRLSRKIGKLCGHDSGSSMWSDYARTCGYSDKAEQAKMSFVREFMGKERPRMALDLGCNTGDYSMIAREGGASVIAVDSDETSVERLYSMAKTASADILPLCMDLGNPSPGIGFRNRERSSFLERGRGRFDCVLALALVHHLLVSSRIPLPQICDFLAGLTEKWLVVEFVAVDDPMFQRLLSLRENIYGHITRSYFEATFAERFDMIISTEIPDARRYLYVFRRKKKAGTFHRLDNCGENVAGEIAHANQ